MIFFFAFLGMWAALAFFGKGEDAMILLIYLPLQAFGFFKSPKRAAFGLAGFIFGSLVFFLIPRPSLGNFSQNGIIIRAEENWYILLTLKGKFYFYKKNADYEMFDVIKVQGITEELDFAHYQESFDFKDYLASQSCFRGLYVKSTVQVFKNPLRLTAWKKSLLSSYSSSVSSFIAVIVFSDPVSRISAYGNLKSLGLINLLGSSGLHLAAIIYLINHLLGKKLSPKKTLGFSLGLSLIYTVATSFSLSGLRLLFFYSFSFLASIRKWELEYQEKLSLAGLMVLIIQPLAVLSSGFYLSFFLLMLFSFFRFSLGKRIRFRKIKSSLLFLLLILPIRLYLEHSFSPAWPFLELAFQPILSGLYLLNLLVFLGPISCSFLEGTDRLFLKLFGEFSAFRLQFSAGTVSLAFILVFYFLFCLIFWLYEKRFRKASKILGALAVLFLSVSFLPDLKEHFEVDFIDVGQGDATLIRNGRENILVDTGGNINFDLAEECLIPYFRSLKIYRLDLVVTTHDDYDHSGALSSLEIHFPLGEVHKGGELTSYHTKSGFEICDLNHYRYEGCSSNYGSAVYSFEVKKTSFLIMGDAVKEVEKKILQDQPAICCDVLKVGHHGSDTSSSPAFLKATHPKLAIISCGLHNAYGHPSAETLVNLQALSIPYARTDLKGTIKYRIE